MLGSANLPPLHFSNWPKIQIILDACGTEYRDWAFSMQKLFLAQLAPRHEFKGRVENACVANSRGERKRPATVCCSPLTESSTSQATLVFFRPCGERGTAYRLLRLYAADHFSPQKHALTSDKDFTILFEACKTGHLARGNESTTLSLKNKLYIKPL
jgi:hypothetical protein